ncbi:hypothetical protein AGMMS50267_12800 [Spirochaetia bacterium]|nr:hypothetical protein AGMMS50267_12800 [Spirochaetia bacterium]
MVKSDTGERRMNITCKSAKEIIPEVIAEIEKNFNDKGHLLRGIPTGFSMLDKGTDGFQPSNLIVIGSRPGEGKTSFALSLVANMVVNQKIPAAWFSPDMPDTFLLEQLASNLSEIEINKLRSGFLATAEFGKLADAVDLIYEAPLFVVDERQIPLSRLVRQARKLRHKHKIEIIFIDDLALISAEQRWLVSRTLKNLAYELHIPIVVLSQLTQDYKGQEPNLAALGKWNTLEEDADLIIFLHHNYFIRDNPNEFYNNDRNVRRTSIVIAKSKNSPTGVYFMLFKAHYRRFLEVRDWDR